MIFSEHLQRLQPYIPSKRIDENELSGWALLDWNESTFPLNEGVISSVVNSLGQGVGVKYCINDHKELSMRLASSAGLEEDNVLIFNGSDSALRDCITALGSERSFYTIGPEYNQIDTFIQVIGAKHTKIDVEDPFALTASDIGSHVPDGAVVYISNPNNPTGRFFEPSDLQRLIERDIVLLLDEAYIDFAPASASKLVRDNKNLIIFRTFSKAFGIAGFRLGYVLTHETNIEALKKIRNPKEINSFAIIAADFLTKKASIVEKNIELIKYEREKFLEFLLNFSEKIVSYPSHANFVVMKLADPKDFIKFLAHHKILIRDRSSLPGLANCVRVTIGDPEVMGRLKEVITSFYNNKS